MALSHSQTLERRMIRGLESSEREKATLICRELFFLHLWGEFSCNQKNPKSLQLMNVVF
jgi:hypothetical protein